MNSIKQSPINNPSCNIVRFVENDFKQIKHFILEICKTLDDPTHFITEDIDYELPLLLKEKYGLVYGVVCKKEIVAVQAIDYDVNKILKFNKILNTVKNSTIMEVGWAMVAPLYRRNDFSVLLSKLLEQAAFQETGNEICVATVHPQNTSSIFLFLRLGYVGIKLTIHFNVIRMLMIKNINSHFMVESAQEYIIVRNDNYEQQIQLLRNGYVCNAAIFEQNIVFLKFVKLVLKI